MAEQNIQAKFAYDEWRVAEHKFDMVTLKESESIFALSNGYIGFRGNLEEGEPLGANSIRGTYINGVFDSEPIVYGEIAYGYAKNSQTICNVVDAKGFVLTADGEKLDMGTSDITEHSRILDFRSGVLFRSLTWKTKKGCVLDVSMERLVSLEHKNIAAASCSVKVVSGSCEITIASALINTIECLTDADDPRTAAGKKSSLTTIDNGLFAENGMFMLQATGQSKQAAACAVVHCDIDGGVIENEDETSYRVHGVCDSGQTMQMKKIIAYTSGQVQKSDEILSKAKELVCQYAEEGYDALVSNQKAYLEAFWNNSGIEIEGDTATLQGLRFNMFHLLQSAPRDGKTNIAAKGLTGQGYEGHYFWDTEMYIMPFFLYTEPIVAKRLIEYRYSILDKARERARTMSHTKGALFAWRTINGEECSAYYPAGTAQYHINADIAMSIRNYVNSTGDKNFLIEYGAEILLETARIWYDIGFFNKEKNGMFCINCVTGPDEYNVLVNNNCYTNLMAKENMLFAIEALEFMKQHSLERYGELCAKTDFDEAELMDWQNACDKMYVPYDKETKLYPQDDGFFDRKPWPINSIPSDTFPLLLHYHPMVIYRHQICKQADLILAMVVLGESFTFEEKKVNFAYYDNVTTHDSSLSMAVFSILASEIREKEKAYQYFQATTRLDLDDMHHNTKDGLHMANMAGTWMCLTYGFGGMRVKGRMISFDPYLPDKWNGYKFRVQFGGCLIEIAVSLAKSTYSLVSGDEIEIIASGNNIKLVKGVPQEIRNR